MPLKPQIAYFASSGAEDQLKELIARIHGEYPEVPVILDAKRGDIGSTAAAYAHHLSGVNAGGSALSTRGMRTRSP